MGGSSLLFLYPPHPLLLHSTTNPVYFAPKARGSMVIRAVDGNRDHHSQSSKEEIIALFNRIRSSISKGDAINRASKDNKNTSAESMLEVLHQSTTHQGKGKGKSLGTKTGKKILSRQKDSTKKEDERSQPKKSSRPPSKFTRRSPIPFISTPRDETQRLSESTRDDDIEKQSNKFEEMKLAQLKQVAKLKGIKGYSKLKKGELLELLLRSL